MQRLVLIPFFCPLSPAEVEQVAQHLESALPLRAEQHSLPFDPQISFDESRGQYNSRVLLGALIQESRWQDSRVLGLTGLDLFIPVLTYVFGEAQVGGRVALASAHRLDNRRYGLAEDRSLMLERIQKECLHELGHTYELLHCPDSDCVMSSSTTISGIDIKSARFCPECTQALLVKSRR